MDEAHKATDKALEELEKKITNIYTRAEKEARQKLNNHLQRYKKNDEIKRAQVEAKQITEHEYVHWRTGQLAIGQRWEEMCRTLATDLANADRLSESMTNGYRAEVYALNHNYATFEVEKSSKIDTSYTLYDRQTVERLVKDNPSVLPSPRGKVAQQLREGKIIRWNMQKITGEVTQGILQGESIDKIAKRMRNVANMDYHASIRNARTAITGAQNAGRQRGYERAQDMGIKGKKMWIASMDGKTRHWHVETDGQTVPIDEPFVNEYGEIDYPGDAGAEPANVYNCRCTMVYVYDGLDKSSWLNDRRNPDLGDMTYDDWKEYHKNGGKSKGASIGNTASIFSKEQQERFQTLLSNAPNDIKAIWEKSQDNFKPAIDVKEKNAYFSYTDGHVCIGLQKKPTDDIASTFFHEFGHNIDYVMSRNFKEEMLGKEIAQNSWLTRGWKNEEGKSFEQIIIGEWNKKFAPSAEDLMWKNYISNLNIDAGGMGAEGWARYQLREWVTMNHVNRREDEKYLAIKEALRNAGNNDDEVRKIIKNNIDVFSTMRPSDNEYETRRFVKEKLDAYINDMKDKYSISTRGNLSDMLEKFSVEHGGPDFPLGIGHGKGYATTPHTLEKEAFAEMFESEIANHESLELIKQELPESYEAFKMIIKEALK